MALVSARRLREKKPEPEVIDVAPVEPVLVETETIAISVTVPWDTLPILEAQQWYEKLKREFERAGTILNARLCAQTLDSFVCFMAGTEGACKAGVVHKGRPAGIDYQHKDEKTGLLQPAMICSERCWVLYQAKLIAERRDRELARQQ
jgi:hypothetical protein